MAKDKKTQAHAEAKPAELLSGARLMDAVRDEMAANTDGYIDQLGQIMTAWLRRHPQAEIASDRTLRGAFEQIRATARKKAKNGCYAMPYTEVYVGLMEYYGMPVKLDECAACMLEMCSAGREDGRAEPATAPAGDESLDLDALLEGL